MSSIDFYKKHSCITDPKEFSYLFDAISSDVVTIKNLLQGIILHFWDGGFYNYQIAFKRLFDIETRYVYKILEKMIQLNDAPLTVERSLDDRIVGSCRDYATLFCAILRHHGVPARTRVAFSAYYFQNYYHDEVVLEYWNQEKEKWCLIDPRVTEPHIVRQKLIIDFDLFDVPRDKLIVAGLAWEMARENPALADKFCGGDRSKNKGLWYIRDRLVQDLAALNSVEMQLWDAWGLILASHEIEEDQAQLIYLDTLAKLTLDPDKHFEELCTLYQNDLSVKVPETITSFSPIYKKKDIKLVL